MGRRGSRPARWWQLFFLVLPFLRTLEVFLATYSVIVFATLAGALGAYFLESTERRRSAQPEAI